MTMGRHEHRHTHEVPNPGQVPVHPDVDHDHDHDDRMNEHHHYSEEPAEVDVDTITSGMWECAIDAASGTPRVYVRRSHQTEEVIAQVVRLSDSGSQDRAVANAKLITFSPDLLRFVQRLAAMTSDGGISTGMVAADAKEVLEQLNQVEARSGANRR